MAIIVGSHAFGQNQISNWIFGDSVGISFNTGTPIYFKTTVYGFESYASISDNIGGVLFYTNGQFVWNKNDIIMPNGDSIQIGETQLLPGSSITQGVVIIPKPGFSNLYYIICIQKSVFDSIYGLSYSIVDMNLNGGLGDIIEKNVNFYTEILDEKMQVVRHGNGRDWWLLVRKHEELVTGSLNIDFIRFLISPAGISNPESQSIGPAYDPVGDSPAGQMIFSQDGSMVICGQNTDLEIFNFDRCTGLLSNLIEISNIDNVSFIYGCSISPDNSKIYISGGEGSKDLIQYCLNCDGVPIDSTKKIIFHGPIGNYCIGQHLLGPDNKIYFSTPYKWNPNDIYSNKNMNLSVINYPNELPPLCYVDSFSVSLGDGRTLFGLPNMPNYTLGPLSASECDTLLEFIYPTAQDNPFSLFPNPINNYISISGVKEQDVVLSIYNSSGELVFRSNQLQSVSYIKLPSLPSGLYIATIDGHKTWYVEKILIQH